LDGSGFAPQPMHSALTEGGARRLRLDTTQASYADSDGVR